jgi:RimJ/RimL family protein N-acetyltransferase
MFLNLLKRARDVYKQESLFILVGRILKKMRSLVFFRHSSIWLEKNLNDKDLNPKGFNDFEIVMNDFDGICKWIKEKNKEYPWMYSKKEISIAKKYNHIIPYVKHKNKIVGYTKVALNNVYVRDYNTLFPMAKNKARFYDTTILAEYRGQRLALLLHSKIFPYLKEKKIDYLYAHIEPWNTSSIKAYERSGFKQVFENRYTKIFCFKFHSNNPRKLLS